METKLIIVLLAPVGFLYNFFMSPAAPPQIFIAQFTEAFGHPPGANLPIRPVRKHVYVTHGG